MSQKAVTEELETLGVYKDDNEFVNAIIDNNGKILFGIKKNGEPYFSKGDTYHTADPEYTAAWVDTNKRVIFGFLKDGSTYIAKSPFIAQIKNISDELNNTQNSINNLTDRVESLEATSQFPKAVLLITFDAMNLTDKRFEIVNQYGFVANSTAITGGDNIIQDNQTILKAGWDIAVYSSSNVPPQGSAEEANDSSEETLELWDAYVKSAVDTYKSFGIVRPIAWHARQNRWTIGLEKAVIKYGFKFIRCSVYAPSFINTSNYNIRCNTKDLNPNTLNSLKHELDSTVLGKGILTTISHGIYESEEEAISNWGITEETLTDFLDYVKSYVDKGELEVITWTELYGRYYPANAAAYEKTKLLNLIS